VRTARCRTTSSTKSSRGSRPGEVATSCAVQCSAVQCCAVQCRGSSSGEGAAPTNAIYKTSNTIFKAYTPVRQVPDR
jgi:hypothetical protein